MSQIKVPSRRRAVEYVMFILEKNPDSLTNLTETTKSLSPLFKAQNLSIDDIFVNYMLDLKKYFPGVKNLYGNNSAKIAQMIEYIKQSVVDEKQETFDIYPLQEKLTIKRFYDTVNSATNALIKHNQFKSVEEKISALRIRLPSLFEDPQLQKNYLALKNESDKKDVEEAYKFFKSTDREVIAKTYKVQALKHHPDKGGNAEEFKKINNYKDKLIAFLDNKLPYKK